MINFYVIPVRFWIRPLVRARIGHINGQFKNLLVNKAIACPAEARDCVADLLLLSYVREACKRGCGFSKAAH